MDWFFSSRYSGGCQEEGLPDEEGAEVLLSRVPDNPGYASLPLMGNQWKLLGFVDEQKDRIKIARPARDYSYTLVFKEDGVLDGYASTNRINAEYVLESAEKNQIRILSFGLLTYINEVFDGPLYLELMKKVNYSKISSKGLALYYDTHQYLLFRPME